ncbi:P-loop ATPase, Sll1717 family [Xanthomonas campestris]|uniref:P-loop ATPase, Sll1717 family n=1 Tax=Xanthomonas campestris TaxID=339 RepID=UPI001E2CFF4C|nr:AAA family ATPase [Xanthomonas campestris]MCD0252611.1 AAA family ATPase [Xanthomonas campestris pv. campestris]MEB1902787.1 AAA family ATPase [Xanthomonas campestris pv. campestris]WDK82615.1 AAA family ATPase [Xanthomonas campestris pv. campestris]WDK87833.1 AAA family ATPase [Xanthomonas campestris pv. campestris]WDK91971.1 AAA family ATPase [Xanthomonas campestris pv. campestris]
MNSVATFRKLLLDHFGQTFDLDITQENGVILLVISDLFLGMSRSDRLAMILPEMQRLGLKSVITELYSVAEAQDRGLTFGKADEVPADWDEAVTSLVSGERYEPSAGDRNFRRIVFYSYKGGVGRTTALVQTAFHLARRGRRVVLVDMDVEAPGLHKVVPPTKDGDVEFGLIDYLWERQVKPADAATSYEFSLVGSRNGQPRAISYTVEDPLSRAQVHVVPAGCPGKSYVQKLSTLSHKEVLTRSDDAWSLFEADLFNQFQPDVVLIDARTGLGEWGGLSLLRLADDAFLVMFPSGQNADGINFVKTVLSEVRGISPTVIFSPVPEGEVGDEIVRRFGEVFGEDEAANALRINYSQGIASASSLPLDSAMPAYVEVANRIAERGAEAQVEVSLARYGREDLLESLNIPERDANSIASADFEAYFQKTSDFDKFLDDARWVVRGRKGTGKSTLFHLFVEHIENARKRARGKLSGVDVLPGHGPVPGAMLRPTTDEFESLAQQISAVGADWLSFWRAYAIVRLWTTKYEPLISVLGRSKGLRALKMHLQSKLPIGSGDRRWKSSETAACLALISGDLGGLCRDVVIDLNDHLSGSENKLWLLYDDLDQDIREDSPWQAEALGGLLRLAYDSNNKDLHNIRFKIFLREDIWSKLVFTNKSHFGDPRTVLLQWKIEDFMRLAYRLITGASPPLRELIGRDSSVTEQTVDTAGEEELRGALAPIWGLSQEKGKKSLAAKWVYSRMTDSQDNTYPRSLTVLLKAARDEELRIKSKSPPSDRLLSFPAMQVGLKAASVERLDALKNECPDLKPFLEDVEEKSSLRSQFASDDLRKVWATTSKSNFPLFDAFISRLEESGLLVRKRGSTYNFGFASLYIDGLGVTRVQGEKK